MTFLGIHYLHFKLLKALFFDSMSHSAPEGCPNSLSMHILLLLKCVHCPDSRHSAWEMNTGPRDHNLLN